MKQQPSPPALLSYVRLFITGFVMGSADVVPGVSGGTIAFIFGIYEQLLAAVKTMSGGVLRAILQLKLVKAWQLVPFGFLIPLGLGLFTAILTLASFIEMALHQYPVYIWSYFFGLVLVSIWIVRKRVQIWTRTAVVGLILATIVAYVLVGLVPVQTPATLLAFFLSGMVAICAMILPGVSGSFLLIVLGKYEQVLSAVTSRDFLTLAVFTLGAVVGLSFFSRLLQFLFKRYHDVLVAVLIGFMIGSLRKVWPWKEVVEYMQTSKGELVPVQEALFLPTVLNTEVFMAGLLCVLGIATILFLTRLQQKLEHSAKA